MRRNELTSCIALGGIVLLAAVLALRFDLASPLLPDAPATSATKRASSAGVAAPFDRRPVDDAADKPSSSTFDVVRIDPEGSSVFAGRAPANASVTVLANDKPVATAKSNADGQWAAVIDRQFAPGEYQLSLTAKPAESGAQLPGQSVNITIASSARPTPADTKVVAVSPPGPAFMCRKSIACSMSSSRCRA